MRRPNGQFAPGPMDPELKTLIGQGQIARHRRNRQQQGPRPDRKRCTKCRKMKVVPDEFPMRTRHLKSGEKVRYPAGECLKCNAERSAAWRLQLQQDPDQAKRTYARWNANRDPEMRRAYQRDYGRIRRALDGAKSRGPWKKYQNPPATHIRLDPEPLLLWLERLTLVGMAPELTDIEQRMLRRLKTGEQKTVGYDIVDRILTRADSADQWRVLYPALAAEAGD